MIPFLKSFAAQRVFVLLRKYFLFAAAYTVRTRSNCVEKHIQRNIFCNS